MTRFFPLPEYDLSEPDRVKWDSKRGRSRFFGAILAASPFPLRYGRVLAAIVDGIPLLKPIVRGCLATFARFYREYSRQR